MRFVRFVFSVLRTIRSIVQPVFRFFAWALLLLAVLSFVYDATAWQQSDRANGWTSLHNFWARIAPESYQAASQAVMEGLDPLIWDPLLLAILDLPMALTLAVLALLSASLGRQRRQIEIFTN